MPNRHAALREHQYSEVLGAIEDIDDVVRDGRASAAVGEMVNKATGVLHRRPRTY